MVRRGVVGAFLILMTTRAAAVAARAEPGRNVPREILPAGRWNPAVRAALEKAVVGLGRGSDGFSEDAPPVAVIALEEVAVANDPGEAVFYWMVTQATFKFGDAFWKLVPEPYGRRAHTGWEGFKGLPKAAWPKDPYYGMYRKAMFNAYDHLCAGWGPRLCRGWLVRLTTGFAEPEFVSYSKKILEIEESRPIGWELIREAPGDETPARARTGLRLIPEMKALIQALLARDFVVFIFSESSEWAAQVVASRLGIDGEHVAGPRTRLVNLVATDEILDPVPVGAGEAEAVTFLIGRAPALVVGGPRNKALLDYGGPEGVRVAIDTGNAEFRENAKKNGWLVQGAFVQAPKPRR